MRDLNVKSNQKRNCKWKQHIVCPSTCKYIVYILYLWRLCELEFWTSRDLLLTEWCHDAKNCCESLLIYYSLPERTPHPYLRAEQWLTSHLKSPPPVGCVSVKVVWELCVWRRRNPQQHLYNRLPLWAPQTSLPLWFYAARKRKQQSIHRGKHSKSKKVSAEMLEVACGRLLLLNVSIGIKLVAR